MDETTALAITSSFYLRIKLRTFGNFIKILYYICLVFNQGSVSWAPAYVDFDSANRRFYNFYFNQAQKQHCVNTASK